MSVSNLIVPNNIIQLVNTPSIQSPFGDALVIFGIANTINATPTVITNFKFNPNYISSFGFGVIGVNNNLTTDTYNGSVNLTTNGTNAGTTVTGSSSMGTGTMAACNFSYIINDATFTITFSVIGAVGVNARFKSTINNNAF